MGKGEIANEVKVKYFKSSEASYIYDDANKIYKDIIMERSIKMK